MRDECALPSDNMYMYISITYGGTSHSFVLSLISKSDNMYGCAAVLSKLGGIPSLVMLCGTMKTMP